MPDRDDFSKAIETLKSLPVGTSYGAAYGRRYVVSKTLFNGGKSIKLVGEALDGSDYISLNWYDLNAGPRVKPCEMPLEKVIGFLSVFEMDAQAGRALARGEAHWL